MLGFLWNQLQVWQQRRFDIGDRSLRAQGIHKLSHITSYNPVNWNACQFTIRGAGVSCSQYAQQFAYSRTSVLFNRPHSDPVPGDQIVG